MPDLGDRSEIQQTSLPGSFGGRRVARLLLATGLSVLSVWIVFAVLVALVWAVLLAITVWPLHKRVLGLPTSARRRTIGALVVTLVTSVALLVPVAFVVLAIGREAETSITWLTEAQQIGIPVPDWVAHIPLLGRSADAWWRSHLSDPKRAADLLSSLDLSSLAAWSQTLGGRLAHTLVLVFITFPALFFLLRDGDLIGARFLAVMDYIFGDPGERLATKLVATVRGIVDGTVLVALGEGILIGVAYVVTGVPHPILFGALTVAFAMLPLGAWIAFGAASLVLLIENSDPFMAASLFGFGAVVMLIGDNLVQPALIGGAARLPFLWTLVGILGGLQTFGVVGLFLGPVVMAAFLTVWREWIEAPAVANE
jgi:predicted PurR-regulated permease PerM